METISKQKFLIEQLKKVVQEQERKLNKFNRSFAETLQERQTAIFESLNKTQSLFNTTSDQQKIIKSLEQQLNANKHELKNQIEKLEFIIDTQNTPALF